MPYQKYDKKSKTIYWNKKMKKKVLFKTDDTLTFRSLLEYEVFTFLSTLIGCEVLCQVPIKGESFTWCVDFMIRPKNDWGKRSLFKFRELLSLGGYGSLYVEAKGMVTKEFVEKLTLCKSECPSIYRNLIAFGESPIGVVIEEDLLVTSFPIMSTNLLKKVILLCNSLGE